MKLDTEAFTDFKKSPTDTEGSITNGWPVNEALDAAASMIADLAGATVQAGIVSAGSLDTSDVEVASSLEDVNRVLGTDLLYTDIEDVFLRIASLLKDLPNLIEG